MDLKQNHQDRSTDISFIIVNWNTRDLLLDCLKSVFETVKNPGFEVLVVDNASVDGSAEAVAESYPQVNLIRNKANAGFAAANNRAFRLMRGRYALLLNSDAFLTPGAADDLYRFMEENSGAGMACGQLLNPDGSLQNSFAPFPCLSTILFNETLLRLLFPSRFRSKTGPFDGPTPVDSCIGACMIVRRAAMDSVGLFDENFFFFFEETDWARRMREEGWQVFFVPSARIFHHQGASIGITARGRMMFYQSRYLYLRKWHPALAAFAPALLCARLGANVLLNLAGVLLTIGIHKKSRHKLPIYLELFWWHLCGRHKSGGRSGKP